MTEEYNNFPTVALRGMTVLPAMIIHFDISRKMSIKAVEKAMSGDQRLFVVTQRNPELEEPVMEDLYSVGTVVMIKQIVKMPNKILRVLAEGIQRAELVDMEFEHGYIDAHIVTLSEDEDNLTEAEKEALIRDMKERFELFCAVNGKMSNELVRQIGEIRSLTKAAGQIAMNLPLNYEQKQRILERVDIRERCELLSTIMEQEIDILRIKKEIQDKVKLRLDQNQREYIMREQMKLIREELKEDAMSEADEFEQALQKLDASEEVKTKIKKEISHFRNVGMNSAEASVIRTYIETLLDMPWNQSTVDSNDIKRAKETLEEDHYGLEKVKERILEFLAVRALTDKANGQILCLVGPPGTGKTSIAKSIARALGKKYERISLGGVRDEAEIRGHRRTYIGAMPGRIAAAIRHAGVNNPLMLLDEIDKLGRDYKGDTAAAMLEVLDGEQNVKFQDHYLEIPLDLSQVFFIATANDAYEIPGPLYDRMDIVEVSSYTDNEKFHIAKDYLIRKQREKNGLKEEQIRITDAALRKVITSYTAEAGVRSLERKIGDICRKTARMILEEEKTTVKVTKDNLEEFLGKSHYNILKKNKKDEIGIVRGLAWTSVGGVTMQVEVNILPGRGDLKITGLIKEVMRESAQIALSYVRSECEGYVDAEFFANHDFHIHIPEGAVPKDGPSAGVTMSIALASAIAKAPVRADVAMTGEVTLRGKVLAIGGLKEKLLAAKQAGMKIVFVPRENKPDVEEISKEITDGLDIRFAETVEDIAKVAILPVEKKSESEKKHKKAKKNNTSSEEEKKEEDKK